MSGRSKGFDPLSNLFDAPSSPGSVAAPDEVAAPAEDKVALAKRLAAEAQAKATQKAQEDKVALAKRLAAEAQAKTTQKAQDDKVALAKRLAAEAQAKAAQKAQEDKVALAKRLAAEAQAKAKKKAAPPKKKSLLDRAPRARGPQRAMSALEAARAAAEAEQVRKEKQATASRAKKVAAARSTGSSIVQKVLGTDVSVGSGRPADQRDLLLALWRAHRTRHQEDAAWGLVGVCAAVLDALERVAPGALVAFPATSGEDSLLVWVDTERGAVVTVVPNGRSYLAGLSEG